MPNSWVEKVGCQTSEKFNKKRHHKTSSKAYPSQKCHILSQNHQEELCFKILLFLEKI